MAVCVRARVSLMKSISCLWNIHSGCSCHHVLSARQNSMLSSGPQIGSKDSEETTFEMEEFKVSKAKILNLSGSRAERDKFGRGGRLKLPVLPPRYKRMPVDQNWGDVWPTATTFKGSAVPFPVRQGLDDRSPATRQPPPAKYGNLELMKIPNFLHLAPPAVKKHCDAIKKFCTPWPEALKTDEDCQKYFPLAVKTSTYCYSSSSLRNPLARVVKVQLQLESLNLDDHAKDKFIRLVGRRYQSKNDTIFIVTDVCPLSSQNYDYAMYLLTACYFESKKIEPWESRKSLHDWETYVWEMHRSKTSTLKLINRTVELSEATSAAHGSIPRYVETLRGSECEEETLCKLDEVANMKDAVTALHNNGETEHTLANYKRAVKSLLGLDHVTIPNN